MNSSMSIKSNYIFVLTILVFPTLFPPVFSFSFHLGFFHVEGISQKFYLNFLHMAKGQAMKD